MCRDEHFSALKFLLQSMSDYLKHCTLSQLATWEPGVSSDCSKPRKMWHRMLAVWQTASRTSIELICSVLTLQLNERPRLDSCTKKKKRNSREMKEKKQLKKAHNAEADPGFQFRKIERVPCWSFWKWIGERSEQAMLCTAIFQLGVGV